MKLNIDLSKLEKARESIGAPKSDVPLDKGNLSQHSGGFEPVTIEIPDLTDVTPVTTALSYTRKSDLSYTLRHLMKC